MSTSKILKIEANESGVGTITLNRPDIHNAFDDQLIKELILVLQKLEQNPKIRLIVLKAEGKSFSAGADLNWMRRMADYSWDENYQDSLILASLMQTLHHLKTPTLAVVQGAAFGGGVGLVACCDIVIASDRAKFCLSEVKLGLIPAVISPYVVSAIGSRQAHRYFISAELFNANKAEQIGLVHEVVEHENLDNRANEMIKTILANSPNATKAAKDIIRMVESEPMNESLIRETAQKIADIRASLEGKEGVSAFLEKRQPNWSVKQTL